VNGPTHNLSPKASLVAMVIACEHGFSSLWGKWEVKPAQMTGMGILNATPKNRPMDLLDNCQIITNQHTPEVHHFRVINVIKTWHFDTQRIVHRD